MIRGVMVLAGAMLASSGALARSGPAPCSDYFSGCKVMATDAQCAMLIAAAQKSSTWGDRAVLAAAKMPADAYTIPFFRLHVCVL